MREAGIKVEVLIDHFPPGTRDIHWIPVIARRGWVTLTHDLNLRYNAPERDAIMRSGLRVIVIRSGSTRAQMAQIFLDLREPILDFLQQHPAPFISRLYHDRIEMWLSRDDWMP